jgi:hypothetical protein
MRIGEGYFEVEKSNTDIGRFPDNPQQHKSICESEKKN